MSTRGQGRAPSEGKKGGVERGGEHASCVIAPGLGKFWE
jgi:hypothetical protein